MRLSILAIASCLAAFATAPASALDYLVDPGFASSSSLGGWTREYFGSLDEKTIGFARSSDAANAGFILAVSYPGGTNGQRIGLFKLDREGNRVGSGFGTAGRVLIDLGFTTVNAMTVDSSGRIIVAGSRPGADGVGEFAVARFKADGSLDIDFGVEGVTRYSFKWTGTAFAETSRSVVTDADGKIVVTGNVGIAGGPNLVGLFRLLQNGLLDTTFGSLLDGMGSRLGSLVHFSGTRDAYASSVLKVANGQYVVVGTSVYNATDTDFAARLFRSSGEVWAGDTGTIQLPVDEPGPGGSLYDTATAAVAIDPLTILVIGTASNRTAARRFKLDNGGAGPYDNLVNDSSFVGSGIDDRPYRFVATIANTYPNGVAIRGNGEALIVGRMFDQVTAGRQYGLLTRLRPNGQPDPTFATTDGTAVQYAPVLGGGTSWFTEFTHVLLDGARPVIAGHAVDSTTAINDYDAIAVRLRSDMIFANGFQ